MYQEIRAKRVKKIKSKLYRKIKRKQKEKDEAKEHEIRLKEDPAFALEELEKAERARALERARMRHKNQSKYA